MAVITSEQWVCTKYQQFQYIFWIHIRLYINRCVYHYDSSSLPSPPVPLNGGNNIYGNINQEPMISQTSHSSGKKQKSYQSQQLQQQQTQHLQSSQQQQSPQQQSQQQSQPQSQLQQKHLVIQQPLTESATYCTAGENLSESSTQTSLVENNILNTINDACHHSEGKHFFFNLVYFL